MMNWFHDFSWLVLGSILFYKAPVQRSESKKDDDMSWHISHVFLGWRRRLIQCYMCCLEFFILSVDLNWERERDCSGPKQMTPTKVKLVKTFLPLFLLSPTVLLYHRAQKYYYFDPVWRRIYLYSALSWYGGWTQTFIVVRLYCDSNLNLDLRGIIILNSYHFLLRLNRLKIFHSNPEMSRLFSSHL